MNHNFDIAHAQAYGLPEAVLIANFQFWISRNKANRENERDGRTWTYNSVKALAQLFPYLSGGQIRRALDSLVEQAVLVTGIFNDRAVDRTKWYAFNDECKFLGQQMNLPDSTNGVDETDKTLTKKDVNTDVNTDNTGAAPAVVPAPKAAGKAFDPRAELIALGVSERVAVAWLGLRKAKRAVVTDVVLEEFTAEAAKAGLSMEQVLRLCCNKGWQGFEASWVAPRSGVMPGPHGKKSAYEQGMDSAAAAKAMLFGKGPNHA